MSHFLTLPFEIRSLVYEHLFATDTVLFLWLGEHEQAEKYAPPIPTMNRLTEVPHHRGILTVCRQCYSEAYRIQRRSIRHLVVEFEAFQKAWPYADYRHRHLPGDCLTSAWDVLSRIGRDEKFRELLRQIRKLTLPDLFMEGKWDAQMRTVGLEAVRCIEFVSPYGYWRDFSLRGGDRLIEGVKLRNARSLSISHWHPTRHSRGAHVLSWFRTSDAVEPGRTRISSPLGRQILWAADIEWTLYCEDRVEGAEPYWRNPGHRFRDSCLIIQYMITYDCKERKLVSIDVSSKKASPLACDRCLSLSKSLFLRFIGSEVALMLDLRSIEVLDLEWKRQRDHGIYMVARDLCEEATPSLAQPMAPLYRRVWCGDQVCFQEIKPK